MFSVFFIPVVLILHSLLLHPLGGPLRGKLFPWTIWKLTFPEESQRRQGCAVEPTVISFNVALVFLVVSVTVLRQSPGQGVMWFLYRLMFILPLCYRIMELSLQHQTCENHRAISNPNLCPTFPSSTSRLINNPNNFLRIVSSSCSYC